MINLFYYIIDTIIINRKKGKNQHEGTKDGTIQ